MPLFMVRLAGQLRKDSWASLTLAGGVVLLSACSTKTPTPAWKIEAHTALSSAEESYLNGDTRMATLELSKARAQVSRTGNPVELAQLELRQCALQVASLDWQNCDAYQTLQTYSETPQIAYASYLYGQPTTSQIKLLPNAQQSIAVAANNVQALQEIKKINDPVARLVASAVALRHAGQADEALLTEAIDTASAQGWRRPLLAWLKLQQSWAEKNQRLDLVKHSQLRIQLLQNKGKPLPVEKP